MENAVAIASLGILGSVVASLIWLLKKLFNQNDTTIKDLTVILDKLNTSINIDDTDRREFQTCVVNTLSKLSENQDIISNRQVELYRHISTKLMNVENMVVNHEIVKDIK